METSPGTEAAPLTPNPSPARGEGNRSTRPLLVGAYFLAVAAWTVLLLRPNPVPERLLAGVSWFDRETLVFVLAKTTHLCCYATLAFLGGALARRHRRWVFALLVLHGAATEFGQWVGNRYYDTNRHGCVRDVLIDTAGVAAGGCALRRVRP